MAYLNLTARGDDRQKRPDGTLARTGDAPAPNAAAPAAPGVAPGPAQESPTGTGFPDLSRYLVANREAAQGLSDKAVSGLEPQVNDLQGQYRALRTNAGPNAGLSPGERQTADQKAAIDLSGKAQNLQQSVDNLGTQAGREQIVSSFGTPVSPGGQGLDAYLVGQAGGDENARQRFSGILGGIQPFDTTPGTPRSNGTAEAWGGGPAPWLDRRRKPGVPRESLPGTRPLTGRTPYFTPVPKG